MNHGKKNLRISLVVLDSPLELMDRMAFGEKKNPDFRMYVPVLDSYCTSKNMMS
jgi:hypothetical protein